MSAGGGGGGGGVGSLASAAAGAHHASLQVYNNELTACLQQMAEKREWLQKQIASEERKRNEIQRKLAKLSEQLERVNESLHLKHQAKLEYDTTIAETEAAYAKILESSSTLLQVVKREASNLQKRTFMPPTSSNAHSEADVDRDAEDSNDDELTAAGAVVHAHGDAAAHDFDARHRAPSSHVNHHHAAAYHHHAGAATTTTSAAIDHEREAAAAFARARRARDA